MVLKVNLLSEVCFLVQDLDLGQAEQLCDLSEAPALGVIYPENSYCKFLQLGILHFINFYLRDKILNSSHDLPPPSIRLHTVMLIRLMPNKLVETVVNDDPNIQQTESLLGQMIKTFRKASGP